MIELFKKYRKAIIAIMIFCFVASLLLPSVVMFMH